jgi:phosphate transport system permease protein
MAASAELLEGAPGPEVADEPRKIDPGRAKVDRVFHITARSIGILVLLLTASIGLFLGYQSIPTLHAYGLRFFTEQHWIPNRNILGLAAVLTGTVEVALVALTIGFPLALLTALYITEYSPIFKVNFDTRAAFLGSVLNSHYGGSVLIAGIAVSAMVIPLACSVMRSVFSQTPLGEREAAIALGASRWGVIRAVVMPFGRRGIIGGTMLGLGRALGETVAVLLVISVLFQVKYKVLTSGTITTSSLIANYFGDASSTQLSALLTAGFVLFVMTLVINTLAGILVNRSRSGAGTDA